MKRFLIFIIAIIIVKFDVTGFATNDTKEKYNELLSYGIVIDNTEDSISRVDFLELLLDTLDLVPSAQLMNWQYFEDVPDLYEQCLINIGASLGIAYGYDQETKWYFAPNRDISWGEAVAFAVRCVSMDSIMDVDDCVAYANKIGLVDNNTISSVDSIIHKDDAYNILCSLLKYNSCFSYKYCSSTFIADQNPNLDIYSITNSKREEQSITYEEIHNYKLGLLNKEFNKGDLNDIISYKKFMDDEFKLSEYLKSGSFVESKYHITEEILQEDRPITEEIVAEMYTRYMPYTDQSYCIQMLHDSVENGWVAYIEYNDLKKRSGTSLYPPYMILDENNKKVTVYTPLKPKF